MISSGRYLWSGVAIAMLAASPLGAETGARKPAPHPVLKPGPSAGVRAAQQTMRPALALVGAGAVIALVAMTTAGGGGKNGNQPNNQSVPTTVP
jgi:hypothetical protein